ncbi:hypothetical protein AB4Y88_04890 [Paenarthrobacter sp. RAF9]
MTGISCCGKPGTKAFTVAVASGAGAVVPGDAVAEDVAEPDGVGAALDEDEDDAEAASLGDGAAEPPVDGVQAEAATATLTASRANPRV